MNDKDVSPFMCEVLKRIQRDSRSVAGINVFVFAWRYPSGTLKALVKRGLIERVNSHGNPLVRLTDAGRKSLETERV